MHENHASIVALHRLKTFFKKSADTFASTQYNEFQVFLKNRLLRGINQFEGHIHKANCNKEWHGDERKNVVTAEHLCFIHIYVHL